MNETGDGKSVSCASCAACCCRLEVLLMGEDDVPADVSVRDPWGGWVMRRLDDGWCAALDRDTLRCTIYERRPILCREFPVGDSGCLEERGRPVARPPDRSAATAKPNQAVLRWSRPR